MIDCLPLQPCSFYYILPPFVVGDGKTSLIPLVIKDGKVSPTQSLKWKVADVLCIGKTGLGRKKYVAEKRSEVKVLEAKNLSDFRLRKQASLAQMKCKSDLRKSRLACQQLDTAQGLTGPLEEWYWPEELLPKPRNEESDFNSDGDEELECEEVSISKLQPNPLH